jgi:hypothetical protein
MTNDLLDEAKRLLTLMGEYPHELTALEDKCKRALDWAVAVIEAADKLRTCLVSHVRCECDGCQARRAYDAARGAKIEPQ